MIVIYPTGPLNNYRRPDRVLLNELVMRGLRVIPISGLELEFDNYILLERGLAFADLIREAVGDEKFYVYPTGMRRIINDDSLPEIKSTYRDIFSNYSGFSIPDDFLRINEFSRVVPDVPTPCIVKPQIGASHGVYVAENYDHLKEYLTKTEKEPDLGIKKFRVKDQNGEYRHFNFVRSINGYLIEEFLDGPVISVTGLIDDNIWWFSHDIRQTGLPYRATSGYTYPSRYEAETRDLIEYGIRHMAKQGITGPIQMDLVLNRGRLFVIDWANRINTSGLDITQRLGIPMGWEIHNHFMGKRPSLPPMPNTSITVETFDIPKGSVRVDTDLVSEILRDPQLTPVIDIQLPDSTIYQPRTSFLTFQRGYVVTIGESNAGSIAVAKIARKKLQRAFDISPDG